MYLVWIRPFDALLRREENQPCASQKDDLHLRYMFRTDGEAWKANRLTSVLEQATEHVWGWRVNIRLYRQLSIGVTERHVREVHVPFNRFDDRSHQADLNVAFAWQSGHRPLERGATYGLDGAFPSTLQPSLLRAYQWVSTRWHEFLHLATQHSAASPNYHTVYHGACSKRKASTQLSLDPRGDQKRARNTSRLHTCQTSRNVKVSESPNLWRTVQAYKNSIQSGTLNPAKRAEKEIVPYLANYEVLLCLLCKNALKPKKGIEDHLRNSHQLKGEELRNILLQCATFLVQDPGLIPLPANGSRAISQLPVYGGYMCNYCVYLTTNRNSIVSHCSKRHNTSAGEGLAWACSSMRTFMRGRHTRYWVVDNTRLLQASTITPV